MVGKIFRGRLMIIVAALLGGMGLGLATIQGYGHAFGTLLWSKLVVKITGGKTVEERIQEIEARHPDLVGMNFREMKIVAFKAEGRLEVYNNGRLWD